MNSIFILVFIAAIAVLLYVLRRRQATHKAMEKEARLKESKERNRYHCVEIRPRGKACEQAKRHAGVRYLSSEAPRLPLEGCNVAQCACRYVHFSDRRVDERRQSYGLSNIITASTGGEDSRSKTDRRKDSASGFKPRIVS